ncbi:hypothetical protein SARC_04534 [Sphaeroforma arctica JP610]|uniref:Uncharacterized protein n=1 Tax=Sphaeroforma arctica JP610 TaxID=667725 RepID=A0A0L0G2Z2_9EUKA|nr:hypothetical protein SARC_04534 [Sphaeroforma arctica JP610]KNC83209.1 hypothetical protein SARC_04534 [Sphaeroforma arctica JP610]|eukprot:XP_014157111.1 hypothetical protein SARC_04534 [Sphaeroforma arctica JP610]
MCSKGLLSGGSDLTTTLGMYSDDSGGSDDDGSDSINDAKLTEDIERSTSTQHRKSTSDTGAGSSSSKAEPSVKPKINPVTGSYFSTKPNPMEGLSEEDKEREAEKLMTLFNRLEKNGVMKVMGTNKDGKQVEIPRSPMPPKDG